MKYLILIAPLVIGGALGAVLGYYGKCAGGACPLTATPWRGGIIGLGIGALVALSYGMGNAGRHPAARPVGHDASVIQHINTPEEFDNVVLNAATLTLVDFYADWCPPCRKLAPVLEDVAHEHSDHLLVAKVDVDKNRELAQRYGVRGIPHLILFRDGQELGTQTGFMDKRRLTQWIQAHKE